MLKTKGRFAAVPVVFATIGAALALAGCGGSDPEPGPNDAGYPFDEAKLAADGYPEIPRLTTAQKAQVLTIAKEDQYLRENLKGLDGRWGKVGTWTRTNQELVGGVIAIRFPEPVDFEHKTWPEIKNNEDLIGKTGTEGVPLEDPVPRIEPEIGTTTSTDKDIRYLHVLVDLEQGRVAAIDRL